MCTGEERLTKENTQFEAQLQFVSDAVMAFAHAFRWLMLKYIHFVYNQGNNEGFVKQGTINQGFEYKWYVSLNRIKAHVN